MSFKDILGMAIDHKYFTILSLYYIKNCAAQSLYILINGIHNVTDLKISFAAHFHTLKTTLSNYTC